MTNSNSVSILNVDFRDPDSDGDTRIEAPIKVTNGSAESVDLLFFQTLIYNDQGALIAYSRNEYEENLASGDSTEVEVDSGWIKTNLLSGSKSANINVDMRACCSRIVQLGTISLGEATPGMYGSNQPIELIPGVNVMSSAVSVSKPDEDGDVRIEVRALVHNTTQNHVPRINFGTKAMSSNGRMLDESSTHEELKAGELRLIETSYSSLKPNRIRGMSIDCEMGLFTVSEIADATTSATLPPKVIKYLERQTSGRGDSVKGKSTSGEGQPHTIYMKTEPGGRVMFGELDDELIDKLRTSLKNQELDEAIEELRYNSSGDLMECEGVFNSGDEGDDGNEGMIEFDERDRIEIPTDPNTGKLKDGIYYCFLSLSKVSIEFEFVPGDGEEFNAEKFSEVVTPVRLPECVQHQLYGAADFNVITDFRYNGETLDEYDREICDRGYDDQVVIVAVRDGESTVVYQNYNGEEDWGGNECLFNMNQSPQLIKKSEEEIFDNYLSDYISEEELITLLNHIEASEPGNPCLIFSVKDTGDGLVKGDGKTWIEYSRSSRNKLSHMLLYEDGKSELYKYDLTLEGMVDCLNSLCSQQDDHDFEGFFKVVRAYIKELI